MKKIQREDSQSRNLLSTLWRASGAPRHIHRRQRKSYMRLHAHIHTEAPHNFTPIPHQNTLAFQPQEKHIHIVPWALVNKTALHPITKPVCSTKQFMGQKGKGRRDKTDLDENRKYTCTFVNAWGLPSCIKVLGHSQLQTLLKRRFRLTERSQRSKKKLRKMSLTRLSSH